MDGQLEEFNQEYKIKRQNYLVSIRKKNRNQILNTKRKRYGEVNADYDHLTKQEQNAKDYGNKFKSSVETNQNGKKSLKQNCSQHPLNQKIEISNKSQRLYGAKQKLKRQWQPESQIFKIILDKQLESIILQIMKNPLDEQQIDQAIRLSQMIQDCYSLHKGIISLRKIISKHNVDRYYTIRQIIDNNLITIFIDLIQQDVFKQLKLQSLWILTNIAESEHQFCQRIILRGGIAPIVAILKEKEQFLVDQAVWALGNIAADSLQYKEMIIQQNCLHEIIKIGMQTKKKSLFENCIWAAINFISECNYQNYKYEYKITMDFLCPALIAGFLENTDVYDQTLAIIHHGIKFLWERIMESGIIPYLIEVYRKKENSYSRCLILKILAQFSEKNNYVIETLLNHGIVQFIHLALLDNTYSVVDYALYILSNIVLGTTQQVDLIFQNKEIFPICKLLLEEGGDKIQYEACFVFLNICNYSDTPRIIEMFKEIDAVDLINQLLNSKNTVLIEITLKFLAKLLQLGEKQRQKGKNPFQIQALNSSLLSKLNKLQDHPQKQIYAITVQILESYFSEFDILSSTSDCF